MATATARAIHLLEPYPEEYLPESDGKPMAETDRHRLLMIYLLIALEEFFRKEPLIYVSGNIFVYYRDESKLRKSICPDIFVVHGVRKKDRRVYNLEVERKTPEVVIELTSSETKTEDLGNKRVIYAGLGVKEYFLYDPYNETMQPALRGFRLENGDYMPMVGTRLRSKVLGLELRHENGELRLYDPKTGEYLRTHEESEAERRRLAKRVSRELRVKQKAQAKLAAAEAKAAAAEAKAAALEAENARLLAELAKLRRNGNSRKNGKN
jgi:Uma2 family endonuclease